MIQKMKNKLYERIYLKYRNLSRSIAYETIRDLDLAEDIAQEVFKTFYEKMETMDLTDEEYLRAWIINVTFHKAIDFARKAYRHHEYGFHEDGGEERFLIGESPLHILEYKEEIKLRAEVLAEFREERPLEYELLIRTVVGEEEPEALAREKGITVGNLRVKVHRARLRLQEELQKRKS